MRRHGDVNFSHGQLFFSDTGGNFEAIEQRGGGARKFDPLDPIDGSIEEIDRSIHSNDSPCNEI